MKIYILLSVLLCCSSSLHAGWFDGFTSMWSGINSYLFSSKSLRQRCSNNLRTAAKEYKQRYEADVNQAQKAKQARNESNDALLDEINKADLSNYFTASNPFFRFKNGVFNTTEAAYILQQLREAHANARINNFDSEAPKSEKVRKIVDTRDLPALGKYEHNKNMSKYYLRFAGNMTSEGHDTLRISFIERVLGQKKMQNRRTGQIEDVQVTKNMVKTMVIATQKANSIEWQKITNEDTPSQESEHRPSKIRFNIN